jgi:hypothetical protein
MLGRFWIKEINGEVPANVANQGDICLEPELVLHTVHPNF